MVTVPYGNIYAIQVFGSWKAVVPAFREKPFAAHSASEESDAQSSAIADEKLKYKRRESNLAG